MTSFGYSLMTEQSGPRELGFTDVALVQIGDASRERFLAEVGGPLLDKLCSATS